MAKQTVARPRDPIMTPNLIVVRSLTFPHKLLGRGALDKPGALKQQSFLSEQAPAASCARQDGRFPILTLSTRVGVPVRFQLVICDPEDRYEPQTIAQLHLKLVPPLLAMRFRGCRKLCQKLRACRRKPTRDPLHHKHEYAPVKVELVHRRRRRVELPGVKLRRPDREGDLIGALRS